MTAVISTDSFICLSPQLWKVFKSYITYMYTYFLAFCYIFHKQINNRKENMLYV